MTNQIRCGQFNVEDGFECWLVKFDGVDRDSELGTSADNGRIEFAYHLMAKRAGIQMAECQLIHENGRSHFATRRFDRDGNTKHHLQSLCALSLLDYHQRSTHAYGQLFLAIRQLGLGGRAICRA